MAPRVAGLGGGTGSAPLPDGSGGCRRSSEAKRGAISGSSWAPAARSISAQASAVRDQPAVAVGDRDDPSLDRNLLAAQPVRVAVAVPALVVVADRRRERHEPRHPLDDPGSDHGVQLDHRALLAREGARLEQHPLAHAELADVPQQARELQLLATGRLDVEPLGHPVDVSADLGGVGNDIGIAGLDGVGKHAHDREVGRAQPSVEALVLERGPGVVPEREEHVVVQLLEAARAVCADDHALEAVVHVHGDRHERLDLAVRVLVPAGRAVLADDLLALQHPFREALRQGALGRVLAETGVADEVEQSIAVRVLAREQEAALGARELDCDLEDQLVEVAARSLAVVERAHLVAKLTRPPALRVPRALGAQPQAALVENAFALLADLLLELVGAPGLGVQPTLEPRGTLPPR
jgi:hypothetical protein